MADSCLFVKPGVSFSFNGNFELPRNLDCHEEFFTNGSLCFKTYGVRGRQYKTVFGPSFLHAGVVYSNSTISLDRAHTRLTGKREPSDLFLHEMLCQFQDYVLLDGSRSFRRSFSYWVRCISDAVQALLCKCSEHVTEVIKCAHAPHQKRRIRMRALQSLLLNGEISSGCYMSEVLGKVKTLEFAKPGKYPRLVNDLTTPGSLLGGYLAGYMKTAMEKDVVYRRHNRSVRSLFVSSPKIEVLTECFTRLINPTHDIEFVYYSDDSCVSIRCDDGVFMANVDISSCDTSNGRTVFNVLKSLCSKTAFGKIMERCVNQCMKTLKLVNPGNPKEKRYLKPLTPIEYSGSVLTTLLNNVANSLICHSIFAQRMVQQSLKKSEAAVLVQKAARKVGYLVTCQTCTEYSDLQFLKHSPVYGTKGLTATLNAGVLLRMLGQCDGDLPGRGNIEERAECFNSSLVSGVVHSGNTPLLRSLQKRFPPRTMRFKMPETHVKSEGLAKGEITGDEFCKRYRMPVSSLIELCDYIEQSKYGNIILCPLAQKILDTDYGLGTINHRSSPKWLNYDDYYYRCGS